MDHRDDQNSEIKNDQRAPNASFTIGVESTPNLGKFTMGASNEEHAEDSDDPRSSLLSPKQNTFGSPEHPEKVLKTDSISSSPGTPRHVMVKQYHSKILDDPDEHQNYVLKARFIHYEEDTEGYDNHYGKPHVPCIPMEDFNHLLQISKKAIVTRECKFTDYDGLLEFIETNVIDVDTPNIASYVKHILSDRLREYNADRFIKMYRGVSSSSQSLHASRLDNRVRYIRSVPNFGSMHHGQTKKMSVALNSFKGSFLRDYNEEFEEDTDSVVIITGCVPDMNRCRLVMIQFEKSALLPEFTGNNNGVRSMILMLGPHIKDMDYIGVGRALGSVISNAASFFERIKKSDHITSAIERYLSDAIVIAPGRIDCNNLIAGERIRKIVNQRAEKYHSIFHNNPQNVSTTVDMEAEPEEQIEAKICNNWNLFGGMINDIKNRFKHYKSDFTDALDWSTLVTPCFMFFACLAPSLTFGGLLNLYTNGTMGIWEALMAQFISGILMALFSGQPLVILSLTGPFLVFESSLYEACGYLSLDFLAVRFWAGLFIFLFSFIVTAFNGARLLSYVTMFTEDIFSILISLIFASEGAKFISNEWKKNPVEGFEYYQEQRDKCNATIVKGIVNGKEDCNLSQPNSFAINMSFIVLTFGIALLLRMFSRTKFLGRSIRSMCGDFGIFCALAIVYGIRVYIFPNVNISNLDIPNTFKFGNHTERIYGIFVDPAFTNWNTLPVAAVAAALVFILLFVEVEITEQMLLRKERKLKKGGGLHWDLVLVGFTILICSMFGLPWMCAAAVQSLAHASSLSTMKKKAPGEPLKPVHVVEQRVTNIILSFMIAGYAFCGIYVHIPNACFFGVFFYLAYMNLSGNQLVERIRIIFLPAKYRGTANFLEVVPFHKIVIYTVIQVALVAGIFVVKMFKPIAFLFPLILCSYIYGRHVLLPLFYKEIEINALDGEVNEDEEIESEGKAADDYYNSKIPV